MELGLSFFIFCTWVIDTYSILIKGLPIIKRYPTVFVASQALTYITRFSVFIIMPAVGIILDGNISFNFQLFLFFLSIFMIYHSFLFFFCRLNIKKISKSVVYNFSYDIFSFFKLFFYSIIFLKPNITYRKFVIIPVYFISHTFLMLTFPVLILLGGHFESYRATIMGMISLYTGIFSIYIVFYVERKIVKENLVSRENFVDSLIDSKSLSSALSFLVVTIYYLCSID